MEEAQSRFAVPSCRQQDVYRSASLIDRSVEIFPLPLGPHVGLVQSPTIGHWPLVSREHLLQQRNVFEYPAVRCGMIGLHPTIFHHLLELAVADRIGHVPAHAPPDEPFR